MQIDHYLVDKNCLQEVKQIPLKNQALEITNTITQAQAADKSITFSKSNFNNNKCQTWLTDN